MVISTEDVYELCCVIARQENLKVCITEAVKAGLITGGLVFVLSAVLGPLAIVPSAVAGGLVANYATKRYVPLYEILSQMPDEDKEKFCQHMINIVQNLDINDAATVLAIASTSGSPNYGLVLRGMGTYFNQAWE